MLSVFVMELQLPFDSAQSLDDSNLISFFFPKKPRRITPFVCLGDQYHGRSECKKRVPYVNFLTTHFKILESFLHLEEVGACLVSSINIIRGRNSNRDTFVLNCLDNISKLFEVIQPTEMGKDG